MTVSSVSSTPKAATAGGPAVTAPIVSGPKTLGSNDFMKLLAVQFQQQDPMKPMDDTAFIAQMAQFTALSQSQTMTAEMTKLSTSQSLATANSYLGNQVTVDNGDGTTSSGVVDSIQVTSDGPSLMVGGNPYPISSVVSVAPHAVSSTTTTPAATTTTGGS
jgi:flagellar basal-body rod modification protein FlgD